MVFQKQQLTSNSKDIGRIMETYAATFLKQQGLKIYQKNFVAKSGEIDLICYEQDYLVFVEVRYRQQIAWGHPLETITQHKINKLKKTIAFFLQQHKLYDQPHRFDVISLTPNNKKKLKLEWIRGCCI